MRNSINIIVFSVLLGLSGALSAAGDDVAQAEIEHLLIFVSESPCTFIRNKVRHEGPAASEHLRLKYEGDQRHVQSAELFIERVGTKSTLTGNPYTVNCGGQAQTSREWLHRELASYRNLSDPYRNR